ncbi:MAG: CHAT domain-containing protein, partial [Planctomycetota bacterium]
RNVMSTFWSVDDTATQQMMTGFYSAKAADPDVSIAEAMQRSQAEAIATGEFSHPFFWAPFATFGDGARKLGLSPAG